MKKGNLSILSTLTGAIIGIIFDHYIINNKKNNFTKEMKFRTYYNILNRWLQLKQDGVNLGQYFIDNNIQNIAIYGMGELGSRLYNELKNTNIEIKYAIDKEGDRMYSIIDTYTLDDDIEIVDAIIVTAVFDFDFIRRKLSKKISCQIISLEDVVFNLE